MLPYAIVGFLSAFLLFQVQPVIAKLILPWFGGSSSVWTTCMLFFQTLLLGGYLYSHWLYKKLPLRSQALVHSVLLAVSMLALPILPSAGWKPSPADDPLLRILAVLAVSVGLPYFLLSTTSPLLQAWYARTHKGAVPYRLFALSNAGSLLALLTYPVLVEPLLSTRHQGQVWSAAYLLFGASCAWLAWSTARRAPVQNPVAIEETAEGGAPPGAWQRILWLLLAACASTLLLSATTFLTQDVAAVPFLWILPLCVYLLSFILCFDAPRYYNRAIFLPLLLAGLGYMAYLQQEAVPGHAMVRAIVLVTGSLFVFCMVCHGELARRKPHPRYLTDFYVMVSVGGACGGLFVGVAAPLLFNAYYEFPLGLALCAILTLVVLLRDWDRWLRRGYRWGLRMLLIAIVPVYLAGLGYAVRENEYRSRVKVRNFYGQMRVRDVADPGTEARRVLVHGLINHGHQFLKRYRREAVSYFCAETGIGRALLDRKPGVPWRIGVLGLGIGTLAAYGREGDTIRIYEINPQVLDLANREFSYLKDTPAKVEVVLGDGRLSLEREASQQFDVLVMDAFSGDSVPVHLVTREAFAIYFRHLRPGGTLAVNVSNRHLDLGPVMQTNAAYFGKAAWWFDFEADEEDHEDRCFDASWTLIVDESRQDPGGRFYQIGRRLTPNPHFRPWTDDFSNLYAIIK
jgi:SAM-dependent methyltransferase